MIDDTIFDKISTSLDLKRIIFFENAKEAASEFVTLIVILDQLLSSVSKLNQWKVSI